MEASGFGRLPAPINWARARSSNIFCASTSPLTLAWALARAAWDELMGHPIRSFMNSRERLSTFWRFCIKSSDWWAKEKEWRDSEGKRDRSSEKLGDPGPLERGIVPVWESTAVKEGVRERATTDGLREDALEPGRVGFRDGGCCCRMRWRPERPRPCSWSVIKEVVLEVEGARSAHVDGGVEETRMGHG